MTYAVITPVRTLNGIVATPSFVTDDIEEAKKLATHYRTKYTNKGWKAWADKVKIVSPKTPDAYIELADKVAAYGSDLDWASNGNSFVAVELINWANTLKVRAEELANPESYAD